MTGQHRELQKKAFIKVCVKKSVFKVRLKIYFETNALEHLLFVFGMQWNYINRELIVWKTAHGKFMTQVQYIYSLSISNTKKTKATAWLIFHKTKQKQNSAQLNKKKYNDKIAK